jgi:hypothetical protein
VLNNTAKNGPCNVAITRRVAVLKTKSWDMQSGFYSISLPNFGQKLQFHVKLLILFQSLLSCLTIPRVLHAASYYGCRSGLV